MSVWSDFIEFGDVGDWLIGNGCVYLIVPQVGFLRIPTRDAPVWWNLTMNADGQPTLAPSIEARSRDETGDLYWHGWLRDGKLVDA